MPPSHALRSRISAVIACVATTMVMAGCHGILDVSDPTLIRDQDIANANGANAQRLNASGTFFGVLQTTATDVAYISDEWTYDVPLGQSLQYDYYGLLDQRQTAALEASYQDGQDPHLSPLANAFWQTTLGIVAVRAYSPDSLRGDFLAQLYAERGYLALQMAEDLCSGFPINDVADNHTVYGGPLTTDSAITYASAQLDSALKYGHDSTRFLEFARVVKGRALLDLGKYTEAAATVASVPTSAAYVTPVNTVYFTMNNGYCLGCTMTGVGNREGTNGLPFVSANDPRLPMQVLGPRNTDSLDTLYITTKGMDVSGQMVVASGIEARLIQAEAAVHANQDWKAILDSLRANVGLGPLVDPGNDPARVDTIYSERAFWLFMTGRRLGDLRRLIRNYGRTPETVFPTGTWPGGTGDHYGTATSIPFSEANERTYNPNGTAGCTSP